MISMVGEITRMGSDMLALKGGNVGCLVTSIAVQHFAPHINVSRVRQWLGDIKKFPVEAHWYLVFRMMFL